MFEELTVYSRGRRRGGVLKGQHLQREGTHYNYMMYECVHKVLILHVYRQELMSMCGVVVCWCVSHWQTFFMPECVWSVRKTYSSLRNA